jgi:uncharacterized protein YciI/cell division septum initiation protein DivIVA
MDANHTIGGQFESARRLEKDSRLSDAAAIFQKLFDKDPTAKPVIERLLIIYRKLKDYGKELSVLNDAIAAFQRRQKEARDKWIQSHPGAAKAGKSMLRQLEKADTGLTGLGTDSLAERLLKRRDLVAGKVSGKKGKAARAILPHAAKVLPLRNARADKKQRQREEAEVKRKKRVEQGQRAAAVRKKLAAVRKENLERQKKEERERQEARPSLFIIILRYLVSLEKIDAVMKEHMSYLDQHYKSRDFLVSGRQVPRTGGIILACGKNRAAVEKSVKQDPFVKRKLASADIIEFKASQIGKGLEGWLK